MSRIKVLHIRLSNFKGFKDATFDFENNDAVILGGRNGFGKTGIYDALELLFTGRIKRMADYTDLHNDRYKISDKVLPLVYSNKTGKVEISAEIKIDDDVFTLRRCANVREMKNPVDFSPFKLIYLSRNGEEKEINNSTLQSMGLLDFVKNYSFLNYLSQEESTSFLKSKEKDRAESIRCLFNLERFTIPIGRIGVILQGVKELRQQEEIQERKKNDEIKRIKLPNICGGKEEYFQLSSGKDLSWDVENPDISIEEYDFLLREGGVLDNLHYLFEHFQEYVHYSKNDIITRYFTKQKLEDIAFFAKNQTKTGLLEQYKRFVPILSAGDEIDSETKLLLFADIACPNDFGNVIPLNRWRNLIQKINNFKALYESIGTVKKENLELLRLREQLFLRVKGQKDSTHSSDCPLCGSHYNSKESLLWAIEVHTQKLSDGLEKTSKNIFKQFTDIKDELVNTIITPIKRFFAERGITAQIFQRYMQLNPVDINQKIGLLHDKFQIDVDVTMLEKDIVESLDTLLKEKIVDLPKGIDYKKLELVYRTVGRFIYDEYRTVEAIERKREYLSSCWYNRASKLHETLNRQLKKIRIKQGKLDNFASSLKRLKAEIQEEKEKYTSTVISDIRILFYIYSGRIMQNCLYGRGLFINQDFERQRILITSSKDKTDEVDALFNMSSGQLVSASIALILSLNKLYSTIPYLAIDDPIQTIDDINLYGLIETLRHDFKDRFMLMSTHEQNYFELLSYKFKKWGVNSFGVRMESIY